MPSSRRYPRTLRVNEAVREALADELGRLSDPRLEMVTITGVDTSPDLRHATVWFSALGRQDDDLDAALRSAGPHLRATLGKHVRLKYLPALHFRPDPAIEAGQRIEEIIRDMRRGEETES
jgi:ribosome-binding factor A